ncbi:autotransporter domain-containing protein [Helicobacter bilis]|uniref:autotransporter domain-containing protein n=2 Tax=Helicobacter bilis TaxID=37372 RepID=UPI0025AA22CE|nr:autotransporter domain-containing protein [Helicobacter bilis]
MQTYNTSLYSHLLATHFAYGYGSMNQHFETYKGTFQSHALSFSLMDRILLEKINIDIGLHGTFGFFATRDMLQFSSTSTAFNSDFNAYNLNANVNIGYPFIFQSFSIAPVAGPRQSIITQSP